MGIFSGGVGNLWFDPDAIAHGNAQKYFDRNSGGSPQVGNLSANDIFANTTKQQWSNYVDTFIPIENKLIQYATSPDTVTNAMSDAHTGVQQAFAAQQGSTQRRLQGLGVQLSPDEQAAQKLNSGITQGLADVQSQNTARDLTVQRQQSILGSPAPQGASG